MVQILSDVPRTPSQLSNDLWHRMVVPVALRLLEDETNTSHEARPSLRAAVPADPLIVTLVIGHGKPER